MLSTAALQQFLLGRAAATVGLAESAYGRAQHAAAPKVLAFARLASAKCHGLAGNAQAANTAIAQAERLLDAADPDDPPWLNYVTHARIASDASEVQRDLVNPRAALAWSRQAEPMPAGVYTRAVGLRLAITANIHTQGPHRDLDLSLDAAERALTILGRVRSARGHDYLRRAGLALQPWAGETLVRDLLHRTRIVLPRP